MPFKSLLLVAAFGCKWILLDVRCFFSKTLKQLLLFLWADSTCLVGFTGVSVAGYTILYVVCYPGSGASVGPHNPGCSLLGCGFRVSGQF